MTGASETRFVPEWTLADRMGKSLRAADIAVQDIADYLDMHRNTVSGWLNGRIAPDIRTIRLWALRTGVSYEWLLYGEQSPLDNGRPGEVKKRRRAQRKPGPPITGEPVDKRVGEISHRIVSAACVRAA